MVQDITRYLIILLTISILMGTFNTIVSNDSQNVQIDTHSLTLAEEIKANFNEQSDSNTNMPENYQTQTSAYSEQGTGKGTIMKAIALGFIPFYNNPQGGYESDIEEMGYKALGIFQSILYIMTGILGYLVLINKKT